MKVCETFESIQGEGRYTGQPMLFIRLSGCTRQCTFCDTKYHVDSKDIPIDKVCELVNSSDKRYVCWTGGEPLLQHEYIVQVTNQVHNKVHHLETNGDLLSVITMDGFGYVSISPKDLAAAQQVMEIIKEARASPNCYDIKIVTNLADTGIQLIPFATMLMPLNTGNKETDLKTQQSVWSYCVKHNLKYSPRCHVQIWGNRKGI